MGKNIIEKEEIYIDNKKIFKYVFIIFLMLFFLCLNYCTLEELLGSNHSYINDFKKPIPEDLSIKKPFVAGVFYSSNKKTLDEKVAHYIKEKDESKIRPSMIIIPHLGSEYSWEISSRAYSLLKPYSNKIKRVFIVAPSDEQDLEGIIFPNKEVFKTKQGDISVDMKLIKEIVEKNPKANFLNNNQGKYIDLQLPFLQKNLKSFKIIPIIYGNFDSNELTKLLEPYVLRQDTLIVFYADLSSYYNYKSSQSLEDIPFGEVGITSALSLAQRNDFFPKAINLKNTEDIIGEKDKQEAQVNKGDGSIDAEVESLKDFASLYKKELISIVNISLEDAVDNSYIYKPSRDEYSPAMFDKGASFVTLSKNGEIRGEAGTIAPTISIAQDVANSAYQSAINDKRFEKIKKSELKDIDFSISLLTNLERIRYLDETDLISKIDKGLDGLVIVDGNRQGLLLPSFWKEVDSREDFLKELKLKAGISPVYWSNKIKIYRFRTVEIFKNEY